MLYDWSFYNSQGIAWRSLVVSKEPLTRSQKLNCIFGTAFLQTELFSFFTWRHGRHVGAAKQRNGRHVGAPTKYYENSALFLCKRFLLFSLKNMAVDHVSENQQFFRLIFPRNQTFPANHKSCVTNYFPWDTNGHWYRPFVYMTPKFE